MEQWCGLRLEASLVSAPVMISFPPSSSICRYPQPPQCTKGQHKYLWKAELYACCPLSSFFLGKRNLTLSNKSTLRIPPLEFQSKWSNRKKGSPSLFWSKSIKVTLGINPSLTLFFKQDVLGTSCIYLLTYCL